MYDCTTVKRLFKDGMKIKAIARTLKISKNTVKRLGYDGSINPIYRFVARLFEDKLEIRRKAKVRFETPYGDQSQFDWSPYKMKISGRIYEVNCMTMILSTFLEKSKSIF